MTAAAFFRILEIAVGESYASGIVVDYGQTESGELEGEKIKKKLKILKSLSWSSVVSLFRDLSIAGEELMLERSYVSSSGDLDIVDS